MDYRIAAKYYKAITHIEAEQYLVDMNITDYPRMTKDGRRSFSISMVKLTNRGQAGNEISFESFRRKMKGGS